LQLPFNDSNPWFITQSSLFNRLNTHFTKRSIFKPFKIMYEVYLGECIIVLSTIKFFTVLLNLYLTVWIQ
jgi:hypothetical protein